MLDQMYKNVLNSLSSYIVLLDSDGNIVFTNAAWQGLVAQLGANTDISWLDKRYLDCSDLLQVDSFAYKSAFKYELDLLLQDKQSKFVLEFPHSTIESVIWLEVTATCIISDEKRYVLLDHANIINRKQDQAEIQRLTIKDEATGLANRAGFNIFFENEWQRSMRSRSEMSLLVAELNTLDLLKEQKQLVADVFSRHARRACDLACALKPNQFSLILGQVTCLSSDMIARDIHNEISALNLVGVDGGTINVHIAFSSTTPTLIDAPAMLLDSVALALSKAKMVSTSTIESHCPTIVFKQPTVTKN
jgi:GGDEF domain-containing protein